MQTTYPDQPAKDFNEWIEHIHFPSQQQPYTGTSFHHNRWKRNVDYGKALADWKAMNDAENERRASLGNGTQPVPEKQVNNHFENELYESL